MFEKWIQEALFDVWITCCDIPLQRSGHTQLKDPAGSFEVEMPPRTSDIRRPVLRDKRAGQGHQQAGPQENLQTQCHQSSHESCR